MFRRNTLYSLLFTSVLAILFLLAVPYFKRDAGKAQGFIAFAMLMTVMFVVSGAVIISLIIRFINKDFARSWFYNFLAVMNLVLGLIGIILILKNEVDLFFKTWFLAHLITGALLIRDARTHTIKLTG
jgi:hypothetical protein